MSKEMLKVSNGVVVGVFVKPNSGGFQLKIEGDEVVVMCRESPVKGRVNRELIKEFSRIFKSRVEIVSGLTSRQKKVLIRDISIEEAKSVLTKHASK
jgi:uncharacterized protein (TIGR00251 family)